PIQYSLTYPKRDKGMLQPFDFNKFSRLDFFPYIPKQFPCLDLAFEAIKCGGSVPCFLNAANEVLVERFLNKNISWHEISSKLQTILDQHVVQRQLSVEKILEIDKLAREQAYLV